MLHRNLKWKLVALLLALCLWAYVTVSERLGEKGFPVTIEVAEIPSGLALTSFPGRVWVWLRGEREALETAGDRVQARVRPASFHAGQMRAKVEAIHPPDLTLVRISPPEITLRLERVVKKQFAVTCQFQGEPSPGYVLGKPRVTPSLALVSGPQSAIGRIHRLVVRIDTSYATLGQPQSGLLLAVDAMGREVFAVRVEPQTATVIVPVQPTIASRLLPVFVALSGSPGDAFQVQRITVNPPLVTVAGEADKVKALRAVSTLPLSLNQASSSFTRRLALVVPEGVASISEKTVSVRVVIASLPSPPARSGELAPPSPPPEE